MKKYLPYLIASAALLVSFTGSAYSIYGIGKIFGGHQVGATIMAFALEFGNIITATSLKIYWKFIPKFLKIYLISAVIILTCLTSLGIYGYLSDGFQKTAMKDEVVQRKVQLITLKRDNLKSRIDDYKKELDGVNSSITELNKGLNTNTQTQSIDKRTGQVITNVLVGSKKSINDQLTISNQRKLDLNSKIESLQDSVQSLELKIIEAEANNNSVSELGPLKYLSTLTGKPMNQIVNWFLIFIMIVFQPFAIALILLSSFAFDKNHYLTRTRTTSSKPKPIPSKPVEVTVEPEVEVRPQEKKKRKPRRKKNEQPIVLEPVLPEPEQDEILPEVEDELSEEEPREIRKIVDTNLTVDLADHITKSLKSKKKV